MRMRLLLLLLLNIQLLANEPLKIAGSFVNPPFEFIRRKKEVGFEVDLMRAIATKLNREVVFVDRPYPQLTQMLEDGQSDIIIGSFISRPLLEKGVWATPYFYAPVAALVNKHHHPEIQRQEDLGGRVIGVILEDDMVQLAEQIGDVKTYSIDKIVNALADLTLGKIDALLRPYPSALYLQYAAPTIELFMLSDAVKSPFSFAVTPDLAQIVNQAQLELIEEGVYQQLLKHWFGPSAEQAICLQKND